MEEKPQEKDPGLVWQSEQLEHVGRFLWEPVWGD